MRGSSRAEDNRLNSAVEIVLEPIFRLVPLATAIPGTIQSYLFDRMLGVSTREPVVTADSASAGGGDNMQYTGSAWRPVRRAFEDLAPGPRDVVADLGSGKGKVILIAGRLPYGRVIGVEIDEVLGRCAEQNIRQAKSWLRAREVTSVTASVLDWPVPDELSVVFMFNPFVGETFRKAVQRIIDSYDRKPRTLHIVYRIPAEHNWLVGTGRVVVERVRPANWPSRPGWWRRGDVIVTYRVVPAGGESRATPRHGRPRRTSRVTQYWAGANPYRFQVSGR